MKIIKDVEYENKAIALSVMNRLKAGDRVFGNPAEGLLITKRNIEEKIKQLEQGKSALDYLSVGDDLQDNLKLLNAGIIGEEALGEYFERVVKNDTKLSDLVIFASLSDPEQNSGGDEYISDSDFLVVYGNDVLIVDAKNVRTDPEIPLFLDNGTLMSATGVEIVELHSSTFIWKKVFDKYGVNVHSIHGCVVIVNNRGALVFKNAEYHRSETKPMHISDLVEFLHEWIEDKPSDVSLNLLATIAKMQIRKENSDLNLDGMKRIFKV